MNTPLSSQEYREQLFQNNVSQYITNFISQNCGSEVVDLVIRCQLTKGIIKTPIRHNSVTFIKCIFELEAWIEFYEGKVESNQIGGFACPGCRKFCNFSEYGIDYSLCNVLALLQHFIKINSQIEINQDKIVYEPQSNCSVYYCFDKKKLTQKNEPKKYLIPGTQTILSVQRALKDRLKNSYDDDIENPYAKDVGQELNYSICKLQQLMNKKIKNKKEELKIQNNKEIEYRVFQNKIKSKSPQISQLFKKNIKIVLLGKQSLKSDFVFALKRVERNQQSISLLVVYFVHYGIWNEYELKYDSKPYVQLEQALYIKSSDNKANYIYIIGGKIERWKQSERIYKISFPLDPYSGDQAKMSAMPNLPFSAYNLMGTIFEQNIFLFYGQKQVLVQEQVKDEMLNDAWVLRIQENKWAKLNVKLLQRFEGSCFTLDHPVFQKLIIFLGGIQHNPDGLVLHRCKQQQFGQIFECKREQFFGNPKKEFQITFSQDSNLQYQQAVLCSRVFFAPYYGKHELILSGEFLKKDLVRQREIMTFDWENGELKLNELFSLEPPEQILTPIRKGRQSDTFTPVQDSEGSLAYGNYFVIHQYEIEQESKQRIVTQLLRLNLTNGLFFVYPYLGHASTEERAKKAIRKFSEGENRYL